MRRKDREVTDFTEIVEILRRADTIRLGLHHEPYPYIVPVSFGFEAAGGKITLYFHGAKEGLKHDLIAKNNCVCVEADIFHRYSELPGGVTTEYESFIGFGKARLITGEEAAGGMNLMLEHCGFNGYYYDPKELEITWIYKIELDSFTGKRRPVQAADTEARK